MNTYPWDVRITGRGESFRKMFWVITGSQKSPHFFHYILSRGRIVRREGIMGIEELNTGPYEVTYLVNVVSVKEFEPYSPNFSL